MAQSKVNKTQPDGASVADWLAGIDDAARRADCERLIEIMERLSGAPATTWGSIIGFGSYRYKRADKSEHRFFLTGFANRKAALTVYILPGYDNYSDQLARLGPYKKGKSCLYLTRLSDIDLSVLEEMIAMSLKRMDALYETSRG